MKLILMTAFAANLLLAANAWSGHSDLRELQTRIDRLPQLEGQHQHIEEAVVELGKYIPRYKFEQMDDTKFVNHVYTLVRQTAEQHRIRVSSAAPGRVQSQDGQGLGEIRVSLQGRYKNLMHFLEDLRLSEPALFPVDFTLLFPRNTLIVQAKSTTVALNASIVLQGFRSAGVPTR